METTDAMVNFQKVYSSFSGHHYFFFSHSYDIHPPRFLVDFQAGPLSGYCYNQQSFSLHFSLSGLDGHLAEGTMYSGKGAVTEGIAYSLQRHCEITLEFTE